MRMCVSPYDGLLPKMYVRTSLGTNRYTDGVAAYPKLRSPESKIVTQSQVGESKEKGQKLQAGAEALSKRVVRSGAGVCGGHEELSK